MDSFNIPQQNTSPKEVQLEVEKEGSFKIDHLEVSEVNQNVVYDGLNNDSEAFYEELGRYAAICVRAISHFGKSIIWEVFRRYTKIMTSRMSQEKTNQCIMSQFP